MMMENKEQEKEAADAVHSSRYGLKYEMEICGFHFFKDMTTFPQPVWVCFNYMHMYMADSLFDLIKQMVTEFRYDKHLAM